MNSNNTNHSVCVAVSAMVRCYICKTQQSDKVFLKIPTCQSCRDKLGFVPANAIKNCINCNTKLSNVELEKGEGWCFDCLLPDARPIK